MKQAVIIDCDPGLDDAIALLVAMQSEKLDIKAITTVGGNSSIESTSLNALKLVEAAGLSIKVSKGASSSLCGEVNSAADVHGKSGLGDVELKEPQSKLYDKPAWDTIYEEAIKCGGNLSLIATGPLTNVATTLLKHPDIVNKIHHITLMGGACFIGNITPSSEANIYHDPEAAKIVFDSGIPIAMCGLDVTHKALIMDEDIDKIRSIGNNMSSIASDFMVYHGKFHQIYDFKGDPVHDACAVIYEIEPSIFKSKECHVDIEVNGDFSRGRTVVDYYDVLKKPKNVNVVFEIDREKFVDIIYNSIKKYN